MTADTYPPLPLASAGCACCSPSPADDHTEAPAAPTRAGGVATYAVEGMTCGHCVGTVQDAIRAVEGIQSVEIDLQTEGASSVTVTGPVDPEAVHSAVHDAGYSIAES
ncbi:heavy-metal-associated domain-containing protein [Nesterenkonia sp. MY13]|uniref:Heavy-metal-associated domain-containing protein n=1 Tax=Nesterenkonia sedimenti TaxID=1463632 RepID=A0A7X8TM00_9MICC|nr:heavy-metal-associated domain-containing protein [Nesterenkonia sedimenti]NLS11226.1 heavy-metal-associated domain-containing protein [Nesterenkonia sedimenti]